MVSHNQVLHDTKRKANENVQIRTFQKWRFQLYIQDDSNFSCSIDPDTGPQL